MTTKKTLVTALFLAVAIPVAGVALAQSMSGGGMHGMGGMHGGGMQSMHGGGGMHGGMHGGGGMQGGMHGGQDHGGSGHSQGRNAGDQGVASLAFVAVNEKMHRDMAITYSGDVDADFVRGMIPHHQGAVDMAKIVIAFGKDPEIRKLAEGIVKAQESEIAFMRSFLQKRGQ
jgi:uncharacterized protein (DUF305 family)